MLLKLVFWVDDVSSEETLVELAPELPTLSRTLSTCFNPPTFQLTWAHHPIKNMSGGILSGKYTCLQGLPG